MKLSTIFLSSSLWAALRIDQVAAASNDSDASNKDPTLPLSTDSSFNFEILASLGEAIYAGADVGPILGVAKHIKPGDMQDFSDKFYALANHTKAQAEALGDDPVNVRDTWFSAATYFRLADFYLHGNWSNPLINSLWAEQTAAFNKGNDALPIPGQRVQIPAKDGNFTIEAIWYAASNEKDVKRPTLIVGSGYDAAQEDSFHVFVVPALARGWNCLTYEGPGQPTVRRQQNIGFIPDWERVVTPVVDYVLSEKANVVDTERLALFGFSFGGYLAARAAAFEPRLSAVLLDGGIWDFYESLAKSFSPQIQELFDSGNKTAFDEVIMAALAAGEFSTESAWGIEQGLWSFHTHSPFEFFNMTKQYNIKDVVDKITQPTWIANSEDDMFLPGQPQKVKDALGEKATLQNFTGVAGYHCQVGAAQELTRTMFAWLNKTLKC